jgi:hypothetical protein
VANGIGWGLIWIALGALGVVAITYVWALLDGWEARRDARRRNGAHRL